MAISEFKARCLAVLQAVRETGEPVLVTKRGVPIAEVGPPRVDDEGFVLGWAAGTGRILGNIVEPVVDQSEIEALHD